MELSCVTAGQGPPLVLLHGFTGNHTSWEEWLPELEKGRSVLAVDLPGHGRTGIDREDQPGGLPAVAAALDRLLDAHSIQQADFIGYSMGGRALLHFAHLFPRRVTSMVILSASPGIEDATEREERARPIDGAWLPPTSPPPNRSTTPHARRPHKLTSSHVGDDEVEDVQGEEEQRVLDRVAPPPAARGEPVVVREERRHERLVQHPLVLEARV